MSLRSAVMIRASLAAVAFALWAAGPANAAFSLVPSPNAFASNNVLNGVSASSSTEAWAVGTLCCSGQNSGIGTLAEHWNGQAWSIVSSPDARLFDDELLAVADLSPTNAWAVGLIKQAGFRSGNPLIVHWDGTSWQTVSSPSGVTGELRAVSGDSATDVWAVGDDAHGHAIAMRFDGTSWSSVTLPTVVSSDLLQGVKAFGPSDVWVVGDKVPNSLSTQTQTLAMHWNGSSWSIVPSPNPDPNANILHAVDGRASNNLWAVGLEGKDETVTGVPPGTRTLTEHWDGTSWSAVSSPSVNDQDTLNGVAALSSTTAVALGTFVNTTGSIPVQKTLGLGWNGTSWLTLSTPNVGTTDNLLEGAAAIPGRVLAWGVGFHLTAGGVDQTLIVRGDAS